MLKLLVEIDGESYVINLALRTILHNVYKASLNKQISLET